RGRGVVEGKVGLHVDQRQVEAGKLVALLRHLERGGEPQRGQVAEDDVARIVRKSSGREARFTPSNVRTIFPRSARSERTVQGCPDGAAAAAVRVVFMYQMRSSPR